MKDDSKKSYVAYPLDENPKSSSHSEDDKMDNTQIESEEDKDNSNKNA